MAVSQAAMVIGSRWRSMCSGLLGARPPSQQTKGPYQQVKQYPNLTKLEAAASRTLTSRKVAEDIFRGRLLHAECLICVGVQHGNLAIFWWRLYRKSKRPLLSHSLAYAENRDRNTQSELRDMQTILPVVFRSDRILACMALSSRRLRSIRVGRSCRR